MAADPPEHETAEPGAEPHSVEQIKSSDRAFSKMRRELREEEAVIASTAIQLMLLDRVEQLQAEINNLKPFRERFHEADKRREVLTEKLKVRVASDVIFGLCLSIGSISLGFAKPLWDNPPFGALMIILGGVLIIGAIVSRIITLRKQ